MAKRAEPIGTVVIGAGQAGLANSYDARPTRARPRRPRARPDRRSLAGSLGLALHGPAQLVQRPPRVPLPGSRARRLPDARRVGRRSRPLRGRLRPARPRGRGGLGRRRAAGRPVLPADVGRRARRRERRGGHRLVPGPAGAGDRRRAGPRHPPNPFRRVPESGRAPAGRRPRRRHRQFRQPDRRGAPPRRPGGLALGGVQRLPAPPLPGPGRLLVVRHGEPRRPSCCATG